jgi:hypothetical protein
LLLDDCYPVNWRIYRRFDKWHLGAAVEPRSGTVSHRGHG